MGLDDQGDGPAAAPPPKPYTVKQFAELADLSLNAVYQMVAKGQIPAVRLGGAIRLPRERCDRLLRGEVA